MLFLKTYSGQTEGNVINMKGGGIVNSATETPLSELGRSQAMKVGQRLQDETFDLAFSSDLSRAYDTALAIVGDPEAILKDTLLREKDMGRFENQPLKMMMDTMMNIQIDGESDQMARYFLIQDSFSVLTAFYFSHKLDSKWIVPKKQHIKPS